MRERIERKNSQGRRAKEAHFEAVDWALSVGFSPGQASFAAQTAQIMKLQKKRPVTKAEVSERAAEQWPEVFA